MNIVIDQGNTLCKIAFFDQNRLEKVITTDLLSPDSLRTWIREYRCTCGIYSTVKEGLDWIESLFQAEKVLLIRFNHTTPIPIKNVYMTPATLGKDRLAALVGAYALQGGRPSLVIDAGTAITIDYLSADAVFSGGNIAPGISMRFRALSQFTDALPLISTEGEVKRMGDTTENAIRSGVIRGVHYEISGYIDEFQKKEPTLLVFLTGGDSKYFDFTQKSGIFVVPNLVLEGLNRILEYNQ